MIYQTDYEGATSPGPALDDMRAAMEEVILWAVLCFADRLKVFNLSAKQKRSLAPLPCF